MDQQQNTSSPQIDLFGIPVRWNTDAGTISFLNDPSVIFRLSSSLGAIFAGFHRLAGDKRYALILQQQGRASADTDWTYMQGFASLNEGLTAIGNVLRAAGWGVIEVTSYDAGAKRAVVRITNSWEASFQQTLGVAWGTHYLAGKIAGWFSYHFGINCWATQQRFQAKGDAYDEFLLEESTIDIEVELQRLNQEEQARQGNLQSLVEERTAELQLAISRLEQAQEDLHVQAQAIQQLSTPVVQIWDGILLVPLVGSIDDRRAQQLIETLLVTISERSAEMVIIDITGVSTVDTAVANYLIRTIKAARLLGAHPMLVGISAEVAQTLVTLGVDLRDIETSADLQRGLQRAFEAIGMQLGK